MFAGNPFGWPYFGQTTLEGVEPATLHGRVAVSDAVVTGLVISDQILPEYFCAVSDEAVASVALSDALF